MTSETSYPESSIPWQDRPLQTILNTAHILSSSTATVYRLAHAGDLELARLRGRTFVATSSIIEFLQTAQPWSPLPRTRKAKEASLASIARKREQAAVL
jgi:hypothetical protein